MKKAQIISTLVLTLTATLAFAQQSGNQSERPQQEKKKAPFQCICVGGQYGERQYREDAILVTAYGGPGYYRYSTWGCRQGCEKE